MNVNSVFTDFSNWCHDSRVPVDHRLSKRSLVGDPRSRDGLLGGREGPQGIQRDPSDPRGSQGILPAQGTI